MSPTTGIAVVGATQWTEIKDHPFFGTLRASASPAPAANQVRLPGGPAQTPAAAQAPLHYAGFWIRFGAYLIDVVLLWIVLVVVIIVFVGIAAGLGAGANGSQAQNTLAGAVGVFAYFVAIAVSVLYHVLFRRSGWHATPGKRLLGLHVITLTGEPLSGWRALGRYLATACRRRLSTSAS